MPQLMIARVSGSMFQTRRPEIVAMTQPTTLKNVTISNAPTKSGSEECLTSLAYPQYEFCFGSLSAASVLIKVNGSCPLGPSKKGAAGNCRCGYLKSYRRPHRIDNAGNRSTYVRAVCAQRYIRTCSQENLEDRQPLSAIRRIDQPGSVAFIDQVPDELRCSA
jgi:hypothetical protein